MNSQAALRGAPFQLPKQAGLLEGRLLFSDATGARDGASDRGGHATAACRPFRSHALAGAPLWRRVVQAAAHTSELGCLPIRAQLSSLASSEAGCQQGRHLSDAHPGQPSREQHTDIAAMLRLRHDTQTPPRGCRSGACGLTRNKVVWEACLGQAHGPYVQSSSSLFGRA